MDRHQLAQLSPRDAEIALRSYARRFGELFGTRDLVDGELPLADAVHNGWSVSGRLAAAATQLQALDDALSKVSLTDRPALPAGLFAAPAPTTAGPDAATSLTGLLDRLRAAADRVAATPLKDWARPCTVGGRASDAHELLAQLVADGRNALDELAVVVDAARRAAR